MPDDDVTAPETGTAVQLPAAKPMPSVQTLTQMVQNPNIPGELMTATQKELGSISAMTATIRAAQTRAVKIMDDVLNNEAEDIKAHGSAGVNQAYDVNKMLQIVTPDQAQIYLDKRNAYQRYHDATANWTPDTPYSEMKADIEKLNPLNAPVNSPAFATHQQMYVDAQKRALEIDKIREQQKKRTEEEAGKQADTMMLPDGVRPDGVPAITPEWLKANAKNLSSHDLKEAAKYLTGGAEYSDAKTRDDLIDKAMYMDRDAFKQEVRNARNAHRLSNGDEDHVYKLQEEAQNDAGVKFIKEAMDTKLLGKDEIMQTMIGSLRQKVIQTYLAQKSAHPEWKDSDRLNAAMELEHQNALFDTSTQLTSLAVTPSLTAVGGSSREAIIKDRTMLDKSVEWMRAETAAGRTTAAMRNNEYLNYQRWKGYFDFQDANAAARKRAAEKAKTPGSK